MNQSRNQYRNQLKNPFKNANIRSVYIKETNSRWFSAVDLCAAILKCDYQKARNYWKWLKHKHNILGRQPAEGEKVSVTNQFKFEAADSKLRYTDILDEITALRLIMVFPSPKAEEIRLWIAEAISAGKKITKYLSNTLTKAKDTVKRRFGTVFATTEIREFNIHDEPDFYKNSNGLHLFPVRDACEPEVYPMRS